MSDGNDRVRHLIASYSKAVQDKRAASQQIAQSDQAFLVAFRTAAERHILPVLQEMEKLATNEVRLWAWGSEESYGLQVTTDNHYRISFEPQPRSKMVIVSTSGDSDVSRVELPEVSEEWARNEVEKRLKRLIG